MKIPPLYGLMAEFDNPENLVDAAERTRHAGYQEIDAYSPMPVEGLAEAIGFPRTRKHKILRLPLIVLCGGITGGTCGFLLQWYINVINFPLNIDGKPYNSWPSFIPITFELTILFGALSCVLGFIILNGLPHPYHPVFNVPRFALASTDRFFLCIQSQDQKFDPEKTREFLSGLKPVGVYEVEP